MNRSLLYSLLLIIIPSICLSQKVDTSYEIAYKQLDKILSGNKAMSFKEAVFIVENTFYDNTISYPDFNHRIQFLAELAKVWLRANPLNAYPYVDSVNMAKNMSIYKLLKDTIFIQPEPADSMYAHLPYSYDFDDFPAQNNWDKMLVLKLMITHSGNCHSLSYLYKIIADELNAPCWLSLAPNHLYIKNRCKGYGWYNTELTNGNFPIDAWITASGYIPLKAIQSGIYMDTLSNQQAIALCALDLAKEYEFQTKNYYDGFILKCCDLVLQYHPVNAQALLLKAETFKRVYEKQEKGKDVSAQQTYNEIEQLYVKLFDLGYREMPERMYQDWLASLVKEKDKYLNKKLGPVRKKNDGLTQKK